MADQALKWIKFVLTLLQLGLSVLIIALVRFKLHGSISTDNSSSSSSSGDVCLLAPPQFWAEACTYVDIVASVSMLFTFLISLLQLYLTNRELHPATNNSSSSISSRKRICGTSLAAAAHCAVLALAAVWWTAAAAVLTHYGALANRYSMPQAEFRAAITAAAWISAGMFLFLLGTDIRQVAVARAATRSSSSRAQDAAAGSTGTQGFAVSDPYPGQVLYPGQNPMQYPRQGSGYYAAGVAYGVGPVMGRVAVPAGGMAIGIPVFPPSAAAAGVRSPDLAAAAAADRLLPAAAAAAAAADGEGGGNVPNETGLTDQQQQLRQSKQRQQQQQDFGSTSVTAMEPEGAAAAAAAPNDALSAPLPSPAAAAAAVPHSQYALQPVRTSVRYATVTAEDLQPLSQRVDSYTSHTSHSGRNSNGRETGVSGSVATGSVSNRSDSQSDRYSAQDSGVGQNSRSSSAHGPRAESRGQAALQSRTAAPAAAGVMLPGGAAAEIEAPDREPPPAAAAAARAVDKLDSAGQPAPAVQAAGLSEQQQQQQQQQQQDQ